MIAVLVITDGRVNVLRRTIASFEEQVSGPIIERFIYDDSGQPGVRKLIQSWFPSWSLIQHSSGERQGFAGAVRTGWGAIREFSVADYVFHLEDDFTFNVPIDLEDLQGILKQRPNLAQIALLRQAWNAEEIAAGGVMQVHPDWYIPHLDGKGRSWVEQDQFFTTNPSLYRRSLLEMFEWPQDSYSEGLFSSMLRQAGFRFAYWGEYGDPPTVTHIGAHRQGTGY